MTDDLERNLYPVPQPTRQLGWTHIRRKLFTSSECDSLLRFAESGGRYYRSGGVRVARSVEICYLWPKRAPWAYERMASAFATENVWGFVLSTIVEPMWIQRYKRGGYTAGHTDYDYESIDQSKITAIVPLVRRTSWKGGRFWVRDTDVRKTPDKGDCLLFPSFAWHGLSPVTKGVRVVLSAWVAGPRLV